MMKSSSSSSWCFMIQYALVGAVVYTITLHNNNNNNQQLLQRIMSYDIPLTYSISTKKWRYKRRWWCWDSPSTIIHTVSSRYRLTLLYMDKDSNSNEENEDLIMRRKKNNYTRIDHLAKSDLESLQKQYDTLFTSDTANLSQCNKNSRISKGVLTPHQSKQSNNKKRDMKNSSIIDDQCTIPSDIVSILKDQSLWLVDTTTNTTNNNLLIPPILTSIERRRRILEIHLLQNLINENDETVHELWTLWYTERNNQTATQLLYDATTYSTDPQLWDQAESILRTLIIEYGIYWVEPINRLATLYYIQGKYQKSIDLCHVILYIKPWHFGALSGMVGLYIQMNDISNAKIWSEKRLPTFIPDTVFGTRKDQPKKVYTNQRRIDWVQKAVSDAKRSLHNAEQQLQQSFFGTNDYNPDYETNSNSNNDDDEVSSSLSTTTSTSTSVLGNTDNNNNSSWQ